MNLDKKYDRRGSDNAKHNTLKEVFGTEDVIPMWVADMDFKAPKKIVKALENRAKEGFFGYVYNDKSIYDAICNWQKKRYDWDIKKGSVSLANGVVSSISFIINVFSKPNDEIIIQTPVYHPFYRVIKKNNRKVSANSLKIVDGEYRIDYKDLQKRAKKAKILILCNPHNPTGKVFTEEELKKIGEICLQNDVLIISDEIHSDFIFENKRHIPIASVSKKLSKITFTLNAASKSFNIAGLMTSYIICENKKNEALLKSYLERFEICDNNIFGTLALKTAYDSCEQDFEEILKYLEKNRDFAYEYIKDNIPLIDLIKPQGTYLLWINFRKLGLKQKELERFLITKVKLGLSSGIIFGKEGEGYMRMNIATQRDTLKIALENLKEAINSFIVI